MAKEPVVFPARADQSHPAPPPPYVILLIGNQRYKIEPKVKITPLPNRPAEIIPINGKR